MSEEILVELLSLDCDFESKRAQDEALVVGHRVGSVAGAVTEAVPGQPPWDSEVSRHDTAASQEMSSGKAMFTSDLHFFERVIFGNCPGITVLQ